MEILQQKPNTKRPAIVQAATSLFAARGVDGISMREIAQAAGVQEAAIYRHFASKEALAREIFLSWYGWHCQQVREIMTGTDSFANKLHALVRQEFTVAERYPEAFLYFCANEGRFLSALSPEVPAVRTSLIQFMKEGQRQGAFRAGDPEVIIDMLAGAICEVAFSGARRKRRGSLCQYIDLVADNCWRMLAA